MEPRIGAAILVIEDIPEAQSEDSGGRSPVLVGYADLECFTQALHQILKPGIRSGRQPMPAARNHKQMVELPQQVLRSSASLNQAGSFGMMNAALDGIFIEAREHLV